MLVTTTIQNSVIKVGHGSIFRAFSKTSCSCCLKTLRSNFYSLPWKQQLGGWKSPLVAVLELTASEDLPELMRFQPAVTEFLQRFYIFHFSEHFVLVILLGPYFWGKMQI